MNKSEHFLHLCQTRENYFRAWENGDGPGQLIPPRVLPFSNLPPGPGTELSKLLGCGGCKFATKMNDWGWERCIAEIDTLIVMMQESYNKMTESAARRLIVLAIERSR
jgi:hypothetical protein